MKYSGAGSVIVLLCVAALGGCRDAPAPGSAAGERNHTSVLGGYGKGPQSAGETTPKAGPQNRAITAPDRAAQVVQTGADTAIALWVKDGGVLAARYAAGTGWSAPQPLEDIYGEASDARLAGNASGAAMAVWRHTVGNIRSLRYSHFGPAAGWSVPDVMPGALPRPRSDGPGAAPQVRMEADGQAFAEWPSGFVAGEMQRSRYVPGHGWTRALSEPVTASTSAAPAGPAPSTVQ